MNIIHLYKFWLKFTQWAWSGN